MHKLISFTEQWKTNSLYSCCPCVFMCVLAKKATFYMCILHACHFEYDVICERDSDSFYSPLNCALCRIHWEIIHGLHFLYSSKKHMEDLLRVVRSTHEGDPLKLYVLASWCRIKRIHIYQWHIDHWYDAAVLHSSQGLIYSSGWYEHTKYICYLIGSLYINLLNNV